MVGRWTAPDGAMVEVISLRRDRPGAWIRVTRDGWLVGRGYFRTVRELAEVVDLASLVER